MHIYEAIAEQLHSSGTRKIFGLIGEDVAELLVACTGLGMSYYSGRHETGAVAMADGYARASGGLGVAVVSKGPGLLNALNAIVTAARGDSPLVVFAGDSPAGLSPVLRSRKGKYIDQRGVLDAAGVVNIRLESPDTALDDVGNVLELASQGVTVVVNMPRAVFVADAGERSPSPHPTPGLRRPILVEPAAPDAEQIRQVADLLETTWAAGKPVILAGRGAVRSGAGPALERIGEMTGALMTSTLLARSIFARTPFDIGIMGSYSTPIAAELLGQADLLLVFGASLNGRTTYGGDICPKARVVQFDADPNAFDRYSFVRPELRVEGDAALSAGALANELEKRGHSFVGFRTNEVLDRLARREAPQRFTTNETSSPLDPRAILLRLDEIIPSERTVVTDGGHHMSFETLYFRGGAATSWIYPLDFLSIGSATGVAVGAALAHPERVTVLCVGDGGLMMTIGEIATAARYGLRLIILVNNDGAYGTDMHILEIFGFSGDVARSDDQSFAEIARAMGTDAILVQSVAELEKAEQLIRHLRRPLLIEYKVSTDLVADVHFGSLKSNLPD